MRGVRRFLVEQASRYFPDVAEPLSLGGAAPAIGRAFARQVGADPLARNDELRTATVRDGVN
jgi:hypothetical protein